jgi:hypothetical protein
MIAVVAISKGKQPCRNRVSAFGGTDFARPDTLAAQTKLARSASEIWCARQDSNLRPLAPEANALSS